MICLSSAGGPTSFQMLRSEERRVGKSVDLGGRRIIKKKKKTQKQTQQQQQQSHIDILYY